MAISKVGRNDPCPCGSGKKFKHCCGRLSARDSGLPVNHLSSANAGFDLNAAKWRALELHKKGNWQQAADLCRQILLHAPHDLDILHLFGTTLGRLGRLKDALVQLKRAAQLNNANDRNIFNNLGKCIFESAMSSGNITQTLYPELTGVDYPRPVFFKDLAKLPINPPLVSIIVPCYNHENFIEEALRSVFSQTYQDIEIIVIDDGSQDRTVERIEQILGESPFPTRFIARENRGAHATINEGIELASGEYIGILNSDDRYTPPRIDALTRLLASSDKAWGFTGVGFVDKDSQPIACGQKAIVDVLQRAQNSLPPDTPVTLSFGYFNLAISTGNLFFTKAFWQQLGGFHRYRYVHDWDFCLRALERESPAILHEATYEYRIHGTNTIQESKDRSSSETYQMFHTWKPMASELASTDPVRVKLLKGAWELAILRTNQAYLIGQKRLLEMADNVLNVPAVNQ